jgi:hypothetical protein
VTDEMSARLRMLARRREEYVGQWLPEPLPTSPDVAEDVELAESVSIAMPTLPVRWTAYPVPGRAGRGAARRLPGPAPPSAGARAQRGARTRMSKPPRMAAIAAEMCVHSASSMPSMTWEQVSRVVELVACPRCQQ